MMPIATGAATAMMKMVRVDFLPVLVIAECSRGLDEVKILATRVDPTRVLRE
jgi:hypothetical protein